jgi:glycosyltransferase involved in cell wall biosynthesis
VTVGSAPRASSPAIPAGPALPEIGVIAVVAERWGGIWLSRHQILTRLARYCHVVWYNPPRPLRSVLNAPAARVDPTPPPGTGFDVYDHGWWLPKFYRPGALRRAAERARLRQARRILEHAGAKRIILYLWQPMFAEVLELADYDVSCYHIADEYSFSDIEQPLSATERRVIERVDQVFVHSPALLEKKGRINPNTSYVTNGVDYASFAEVAPEPPDLARIPHPRIGYVGRLKSQLDWHALSEIAARRPDWSIVLVGPVGHMGASAPDKDALLARPNVHYLGNRTVREIPAYTQHMDVCLLCYALTDYTRYIFPLKLHEYLAAGRPVVGADLRTLRDFEHVVAIARDPAQWVSAIEAALSPAEQTPERVEERRQVARAYDWNALTERIAATLCDRLGEDFTTRLAAVGERARGYQS